jgi:hypothetical protein
MMEEATWTRLDDATYLRRVEDLRAACDPRGPKAREDSPA